MLETGKYYLEERTKEGDAGIKPWLYVLLFFSHSETKNKNICVLRKDLRHQLFYKAYSK